MRLYAAIIQFIGEACGTVIAIIVVATVISFIRPIFSWVSDMEWIGAILITLAYEVIGFIKQAQEKQKHPVVTCPAAEHRMPL